MNKSEAITLAGNATQLAKLLGISRQAVSQWSEGPIPLLRQYQLKEKIAAQKASEGVR